MANPDSGAAINAMSMVIARTLGLKVDPIDEEVVLANGNVARCCGITRTWCRFGKTYDTEADEFHCAFYVFRRLASPLIMCRTFLLETKTITTFRQRLVRLRALMPIIPIIGALGGTEDRFLCSVDGHDVEALPDSGADVDVISLRYAESHGFRIEPSDRWVMFADRTVRKVSGTATLQLTVGHGAGKIDASISRSNSSIGSGSPSTEAVPDATPVDVGGGKSTSSMPKRRTASVRPIIESTFYVLKDINVDVIVGTDSLETLEVYTRHSAALIKHTVAGNEHQGAALNRIVLLSSIERRLRQISRSWVLRMQKKQPKPAVSSISFQQLLIDADAEELARRETNAERLATLGGAERSIAEEEERRRQEDYARYRTMLVGALDVSSASGR
ncbi:hypothetical protein K491DRAFT_759410 [Lophiostoma macrostomum CBS 122681]|uniref:Uncharacterized protein n=1 Tax=Lophiostoma macrostomum CBS 122681 TaxID=1314788 RepID=A0A6A6T4V8_9PLEO|nr:hypothetical protein K491DRAFT_759410 [Lophiostoma macrostomum CBS 122681]